MARQADGRPTPDRDDPSITAGRWLRAFGHGVTANDNLDEGTISRSPTFVIANGAAALRPCDLFEDLCERAWPSAPPIPLAAAEPRREEDTPCDDEPRA